MLTCTIVRNSLAISCWKTKVFSCYVIAVNRFTLYMWLSEPFVSAMFNTVSGDGHFFRLCRVPAVQIDLNMFFSLEDYTAVKRSGLKVNYSYEFYNIRLKLSARKLKDFKLP